jgi:hypothetical protein
VQVVESTWTVGISCDRRTTPGSYKLRVKGRDFLYSEAYVEQQHRFTGWQTTGKNGAALTVAYDGLAASHPLTAASIPTRRPCSHTEDITLSGGWYQFIDSGG